MGWGVGYSCSLCCRCGALALHRCLGLCMQGQLGKTLHDPTNILIIRSEVERKLDRFELTIIPQEEEKFKVGGRQCKRGEALGGARSI